MAFGADAGLWFDCVLLVCLIRLVPLACVKYQTPYCTRTTMASISTELRTTRGCPRYIMMQSLVVLHDQYNDDEYCARASEEDNDEEQQQ